MFHKTPNQIRLILRKIYKGHVCHNLHRENSVSKILNHNPDKSAVAEVKKEYVDYFGHNVALHLTRLPSKLLRKSQKPAEISYIVGSGMLVTQLALHSDCFLFMY